MPPASAIPESDRDLYDLAFNGRRTSDDLDMRGVTFSYHNHRRNWFWPWEESSQRGLDWGLDVGRYSGTYTDVGFRASRATASIGGYVNADTHLEVSGGWHRLHTDVGTRTIHPLRVTGRFGLGHDLNVTLASSRDLIYQEGSVPGGITEQMAARNQAASFEWHARERWRLDGGYTYRKVDDGNVGRGQSLSLMYGISPDWPWLWAGFEAQRLEYDRTVPAYWSPTHFDSYGLRFDGSFPMGSRLTGNLSASADRVKEDGTRGNGYSAEAGVDYEISPRLVLRFDASRSTSIETGSKWSQTRFFVQIAGALF